MEICFEFVQSLTPQCTSIKFVPRPLSITHPPIIHTLEPPVSEICQNDHHQVAPLLQETLPNYFWVWVSVKQGHLVADYKKITLQWRFSCDGTTWNAPELLRCFGRVYSVQPVSNLTDRSLVCNLYYRKAFVFYFSNAFIERIALSSGMWMCEHWWDVVWSEAWIVRILSQKNEMTI